MIFQTAVMKPLSILAVAATSLVPICLTSSPPQQIPFTAVDSPVVDLEYEVHEAITVVCIVLKTCGVILIRVRTMARSRIITFRISGTLSLLWKTCVSPNLFRYRPSIVHRPRAKMERLVSKGRRHGSDLPKISSKIGLILLSI